MHTMHKLANWTVFYRGMSLTAIARYRAAETIVRMDGNAADSQVIMMRR